MIRDRFRASVWWGARARRDRPWCGEGALGLAPPSRPVARRPGRLGWPSSVGVAVVVAVVVAGTGLVPGLAWAAPSRAGQKTPAGAGTSVPHAGPSGWRGAVPASSGAAPGGGCFAPVTPARVLDTRTATGGTPGPVGAGQTVKLGVLGAGGVPASGVEAVVLNVTVTQATAAGYVTVYPDGVSRPTTSNLNYGAGQTIPNLVVAPVGTDGKVDLFNGSAGRVQLIADVSGWFAAGSTAPGCFAPVTPARVLDTRNSTGGTTGPVGADQTVKLGVLGAGGVPTSGVEAVVLNVTVTQARAAGYVTVYPDGVSRPTTSNLNYGAGQTIPNLVVAPVGADGKVDLFNGSGGQVQLIGDVSGWFAAGAPLSGGLMSLTPARVLDTRNATGGTTGPVRADQTVKLSVAGAGGVPASGVEAVVVNVTVTQPTAAGYLTVYPDGVSRPTTSNLNYSAGQTIPNLVIAPVGADGIIDLSNGSGGTVQIVADVSGYFTSGPVTPLDGVASLASDGAGYCAVLTSGGVDCWGRNDVGQLGNGTTGGASDIPGAVKGIGGIGTLAGVASLASDGIDGYCAILTSGAVDCWGYGADGELGDGTTNGNDTPVAVVGPGGAGALSGVASLAGQQEAVTGTALVWGGSYCAVLISGVVDCWGNNPDGELGEGTASNSDIPMAVTGIGGIGVLSGVATLVGPRVGGSNCAALTSGGVDCWGDNTYGQLGDDSVGPSYTPVAVIAVGGSGPLSGVATVTASPTSYCAVLTSSGVDCWGINIGGELGNGTTTGPDSCNNSACSTVPVAVVGVGGTGTLSGVAGVVTDSGPAYCAVLTSGRMDCWGLDLDGELGDGVATLTGSPLPVEVIGVGGSGTLSGVTAAFGAVSPDFCGQLTSGNVACWGSIPGLPLNGGTFNNYTPTPEDEVGVGGSGVLGSVATLVSDDEGVCALLTTGSVDCWGDNSIGELGSGTLTSSPNPVAVDQIG